MMAIFIVFYELYDYTDYFLKNMKFTGKKKFKGIMNTMATTAALTHLLLEARTTWIFIK